MSAARSPASAVVQRSVIPLEESVGRRHPDNTVVNSRYTAWNFLPMNLYEQFRKPLNFYFLLVAALQFISIIAPVNPLSTLLPLLFAFSLTAVKEGYDDLKRHQQDRQYNSKKCLCLDAPTLSWVARPSCQLRVGDLLRLRDGDEIPCDAVCIAAPQGCQGTLYVRTDNLDGECDLKAKEVAPILSGQNEGLHHSSDLPNPVHLTTSIDLETIVNTLRRCTFVCPPPSAVLDSFDARLDVVVGSTSHSRSLSSSHLLLQSCVVKHATEIFAVVVYTGNETKCGMNKHEPPAKWANIDQQVSNFSKLIFVCQIISAVTLGLIGHARNSNTQNDGLWYLGSSSSSSEGVRFVIYQLRFFLLTTVMIPVSFKFIVDLSKHFMALVLEWDLAMYDTELGEGIKVRNSSIVEDLGQIQYILSDKTGTMTQNRMILRHINVQGQNIDAADSAAPISTADAKEHQPSAHLTEFVTCALLCNTVEVVENLSGQGPPTYHGASPDEEAICKGIASLGGVIRRRDKCDAVLQLRNAQTETESYRILRVFAFSSEKKCMGVFAEPEQNQGDASNHVLLIVKGADDKMFQLAKWSSPQREGESASPAWRHSFEHSLNDFATRGLRTLVFAAKRFSKSEYNDFETKYVAALNEMHGRKELCEALELEVQQGVNIIGCTAIEDKLQDNVSETLDELRAANIRVWMLTGDKVETAEQIALSSRLILPGEQVVRLTARQRYSWHEVLSSSSSFTKPAPALHNSQRRHAIEGHDSDSDASIDVLVRAESLLQDASRKKFVVLVEGGAVLDDILRSPEHTKKFSDLAMEATCVICARVTPSQKARVTTLVRSWGRMTLAIGDGGNDVAMIQEAHVGVGICGKEGTQASRAADFSVSKFSHLSPLLLYHGQASYARTAYVVQYSFYKSMLISFIQLVFNVACTNMSGASFWNSFALTMWNGVYTLPQTLCYCLDRVAPRRCLEKNPVLYRLTQQSADMNPLTFFGFVVRGVLQSAALFWLVSQVAGDSYAEPTTGFPSSQSTASTIAYSALILHQVATVVLESNSITWINAVVIFGMPLFYYVTVYAYSSIPKFAYYGVFQRTDSVSGLLIALAIAAVLWMPHYLFAVCRAWILPSPRSTLRQRELNEVHQRDKIYARGVRRSALNYIYDRSLGHFVTSEEPSCYLPVQRPHYEEIL